MWTYYTGIEYRFAIIVQFILKKGYIFIVDDTI